jgi:hypothetical protein
MDRRGLDLHHGGSSSHRRRTERASLGHQFRSAVLAYNRLVRARNGYKNAFAQIDVQLQRPFDLIPNLVETAKAYLTWRTSGKRWTQ